MYEKYYPIIYDNLKKLNKDSILKIISFILLCISISFNFRQYSYEKSFWGYKIYSQNIDIKPTLITTLFSLLIFGGYIIRNLNEIMDDYVKMVFYLLDLVFFAGFLSMTADSQTNILGFSSQSFLLHLIILMWMGMRSLMRYVLLAFIGSSFMFLSRVNEAMGFNGSLYILLAFISFLIQIYTDILPKVQGMDKEFCGERKRKKLKDEEEKSRSKLSF
jgi:hypothetical protein